MNIFQQTTTTPMNESQQDTVNRLYESYRRSRHCKDFLAENGATDENRMIYAFIGLNEAVGSPERRFTFENGMFIPAINPRVTGRLTLTNMAESATNADEFVKNVSEELCESWLGFIPTASDKKALRESYNAYKNMMRV